MEPITEAGGLLVGKFIGGQFHIRAQLLDYLVGIASEKSGQAVDVLLVVGRIHLADTGARALLDMEQQTGSPLGLLAAEESVGARTDGEGLEQFVEGLADGVGVGVRAEVLGTFALLTAHDPGAGPLVGAGDGQVRVALVVPQANVEPGPVLLDQRVFEHQRRHFAVGDDPIDAIGRIDHGLGANLQVLTEVVGHPFAK